MASGRPGQHPAVILHQSKLKTAEHENANEFLVKITFYKGHLLIHPSNISETEYDKRSEEFINKIRPQFNNCEIFLKYGNHLTVKSYKYDYEKNFDFKESNCALCELCELILHTNFERYYDEQFLKDRINNEHEGLISIMNEVNMEWDESNNEKKYEQDNNDLQASFSDISINNMGNSATNVNFQETKQSTPHQVELFTNDLQRTLNEPNDSEQDKTHSKDSMERNDYINETLLDYELHKSISITQIFNWKHVKWKYDHEKNFDFKEYEKKHEQENLDLQVLFSDISINKMGNIVTNVNPRKSKRSFLQREELFLNDPQKTFNESNKRITQILSWKHVKWKKYVYEWTQLKYKLVQLSRKLCKRLIIKIAEKRYKTHVRHFIRKHTKWKRLNLLKSKNQTLLKYERVNMSYIRITQINEINDSDKDAIEGCTFQVIKNRLTNKLNGHNTGDSKNK